VDELKRSNYDNIDVDGNDCYICEIYMYHNDKVDDVATEILHDKHNMTIY